jgi:MazG family protein
VQEIMMDLDDAAKAFREFIAVVKALRTPKTGCPWDLEQDHRSLRPYLVEESYEVLDAIESGDDAALREELGDLLLQVVLHAQLGDDRGAFSITDVVRGITEKMLRRHPHVFGKERVSGAAEVLRNWERIKAAEGRGDESSQAAAMERLPSALPALHRAQRVGEKAARVHFDFASDAETLNKTHEQFAELEQQVRAKPGAADHRTRLQHDIGDLLFSVCQLARQLGLSAEDSLRGSTRRFVDRFRRMERQAARPLHDMSHEELAAEWAKVKEEDP